MSSSFMTGRAAPKWMTDLDYTLAIHVEGYCVYRGSGMVGFLGSR